MSVVSHTLPGAFAQIVDVSESLDPVLNERRWASFVLDERCPKSRKLASPIGFIAIMLLVKRFRKSPACSQSANLL